MLPLILFTISLTFDSLSSAQGVTHDFLRSHLVTNANKNHTYNIGVLNFMSGKLWTSFKDLPACALMGVNEINRRTDILPNHNLIPFFKDTEARRDISMRRSHALINNNWTGVVQPPIVSVVGIVGAWRSVCSELSSFVTSPLHTPQISPGSTSVDLSNKARFPYFSRVIGSDALQGAAVAALCKHFGWEKIAILFTSDSYSSSLTLNFLETGKRINISSVITISFISGSTDPLTSQIDLIRASRATVIFAPLASEDLDHALKEFGAVGLTKAPYVWLGADGWGDLPSIPVGSLATIPWQPDPLIDGQQVKDFQKIYNDSRAFTSGVQSYTAFCPYYYDAVFHLAHALKYLAGNKSECDANPGSTNPICTNYTAAGKSDGALLLQLVRQIRWKGVTGEVFLDGVTGDRDTPWGVRNWMENNQTQQIGVVRPLDGKHTFNKSQTRTIVWPGGSTTVPLSFPVFKVEFNRIPAGLFWAIVTVSIMIMIACIVCIVLAIRFREKVLMRLSSWRINCITTIGILICMVATVLFGVDESQNVNMSAVCLIRPWMLDLGFNIFFLPLFAKTYRVNKIFNTTKVKVVEISDMGLLVPVVVYCLMDMIILLVWTFADPLHRVDLNVSKEEKLLQQQIIETRYSVCRSNHEIIFFLTLVLLKAIPCVYGALMAYQTRKVFVKIMRDSTSIGAILMFVCIVGTFEVAISFVVEDPTANFVLVAFGIIVTALVGLALVWGRKYWAIYTKTEDKMTVAKRKPSHVASNSLRESEMDGSRLSRQITGRDASSREGSTNASTNASTTA